MILRLPTRFICGFLGSWLAVCAYAASPSFDFDKLKGRDHLEQTPIGSSNQWTLEKLLALTQDDVIDYSAFDKSNSGVDELRKLDDAIYLGVLTVAGKNGKRSAPDLFILIGPVDEWVDPVRQSMPTGSARHGARRPAAE